MSEDPSCMIIFRAFLPSLIPCLSRESVKAVAGSEIHRLEMISLCTLRSWFAHDLVACYNYGLLVVIVSLGRLPLTESANSLTTRLGLPIVINR